MCARPETPHGPTKKNNLKSVFKNFVSIFFKAIITVYYTVIKMLAQKKN